MTEAYPLQWPAGKPRTVTRKRAAFGTHDHRGKKSLTITEALVRLQNELDRLGANNYVISSNLITRLDGLPRSGQAKPQDPGVALYFQLKNKPHCMPCDTFDRASDNIAAIAKHIEATRAIERYGVATMSEMFAGFVALPAPGAPRPWWEVLGVPRNADREAINAAFRAKAKSAHSDTGGSDAAMTTLNVARDAGLRSAAP